jgi:hypothetical protein
MNLKNEWQITHNERKFEFMNFLPSLPAYNILLPNNACSGARFKRKKPDDSVLCFSNIENRR